MFKLYDKNIKKTVVYRFTMGSGMGYNKMIR